MTKSILALTLVLGLSASLPAFASDATLANENPDNCSAAWRDCSNNQDGSNHVVRHFAEPDQTGLPNQQSEAPLPQNVSTGTPANR